MCYTGPRCELIVRRLQCSAGVGRRAAAACARLRVGAFYRSTMAVVAGVVPAKAACEEQNTMVQQLSVRTHHTGFPLHSKASGKKQHQQQKVHHLPLNM